MKHVPFVLALGLTFFSCAPKPREAEQTVIDIDGLIRRQLEQLDRRKPALRKEAGVNATVSDTLFVPVLASWKAELEVFRALGAVNQQIYAGAYLVEGPLDDPQSNLLVQQYVHADAPLKTLRVYYQDVPARIRRLEGEVEESTPLYVAYRKLSLWFEDDRGQPLLNQYEIAGYQKAALRDTVHFRVLGVVQW